MTIVTGNDTFEINETEGSLPVPILQPASYSGVGKALIALVFSVLTILTVMGNIMVSNYDCQFGSNRLSFVTSRQPWPITRHTVSAIHRKT